MSDLQKWMNRRKRKDERLYKLYGESLEENHFGEYIAIGDDGQTILGENAVEVLEKAIKTFGSGNFALTRIGHRTFGQWLILRK